MLIDREKINQAKDILGDRNAELIQNLLQMEKYDERRRVGCCPNPSHQDDTPSCSYNPKSHSFHCFGCGATWDYVSAYMQTKQSDFISACESLFELAGIQYDFTEKGVKSHGRDYEYPKPVYAEDKLTVYDYWHTRGIETNTIDYLDIQQDKRGNTLFQYYDLNGVLVDVKVRPSRRVPQGETKIWHLTKGPKVNVLFNMNKINPDLPLIITQGEGDCAAAVECGFTNTVSINGGDQNTHWIGECWDWLQQFSEIILVHDNDDSGRKACKEIATRLGEYRVKIVDLPPTAPYNDGFVVIKDLNDLLVAVGKEAVIGAIKNAKDTEIPTIIDYTEVRKFDMSDVDGFRTQLADLDDALMKFYMGSTTILTGAPGSGKTSLLSTLICQSVEQEYPVFVYSGELSNPALKSWLDFCYAGRFGVEQYENAGGKGHYYKVTRDAFDKINDTYKGQIFFYKDSFDQKVSRLMQTAENVVRKHGVKTLIFDNMTSVDLENTDENKWSKQEEFIRDIIAFSTKWNVCCLVVLHPKKMDANRRMSLYDLGGVSASINLSHRVLSLYRVPKKDRESEGCDVIIDVLKDRFGSGGGREVKLFYDTPSRRFYDTTEKLRLQYKWDTVDHSRQALPWGPPTSETLGRAEEEVIGPRQSEYPPAIPNGGKDKPWQARKKYNP